MKFNLPENETLPVQFLSSTFNNTSATYKYYWFLSIIQLLEEEGSKIGKNKIFARMLANAWYTVNFFKVSFGKQDKIQDAIVYFLEEKKIPVDLGLDRVWEKILSFKDSKSLSKVLHFDKQVPHWFLSPWFGELNKRHIYLNSYDPERKCLYFLNSDYLEINPEWKDYLLKNASILKDFCFWNLSLFLQKHNPNVPDIPNKLIKPISRTGLTRQKRNFWNYYFEEVGEQRCIYSDEKLTIENYALDHFVPYNFVSHDLNWNLIPAHSSVNSSKSDKLPKLSDFFDAFFEIQQRSFEIVFRRNVNSKIIEDYLTVFPSLEEFTSEDGPKARFRETIEPLITIAHNNGFQFYEPKR